MMNCFSIRGKYWPCICVSTVYVIQMQIVNIIDSLYYLSLTVYIIRKATKIGTTLYIWLSAFWVIKVKRVINYTFISNLSKWMTAVTAMHPFNENLLTCYIYSNYAYMPLLFSIHFQLRVHHARLILKV